MSGLINLVSSNTHVANTHKQLINSTIVKDRSGIRGCVWPIRPYITKII